MKSEVREARGKGPGNGAAGSLRPVIGRVLRSTARTLIPHTSYLIPLFLFGCVSVDTANPPSIQPSKPLNFQLVRVEEFDGGALDDALWSRIGRGRADWNRHMSKRPDLIAVKDGILYAYGKRNDDRSADPRPFLTGGITTRGKFALQYGKVEIRCKLKGQQGAWPAIWMMPEKPTRGWPADGEIDILERLNFDGYVYQTVHSAWTREHPTEPLWSRRAAVNAEAWNVYGFEWTPELLVWTVNGVPTHVYPNTHTHPDQYPWTTPFYLKIDMQLGGDWVGAVDESTLPTEMLVDWVKFYALRE